MVKQFLTLILIIFSSSCLASADLNLLLTPAEISQKIKTTANDINKTYQGQELVVISVMRGAIFITADLVRALHMPIQLETIKATLITKSYGGRKAKIVGLNDINLAGKNVLVVDDIFDSGTTINTIMKYLKSKKPKSLRSLVLFSKDVPRKSSYRPEYILFKMEEVLARLPAKTGKERFVVGYGLDFEESFRALPGIYVYTPKH